jgi:hypothetical protein
MAAGAVLAVDGFPARRLRGGEGWHDEQEQCRREYVTHEASGSS